MGITIKDIARMANTSTATVSFVLRNKPGVVEEKRKRILEIVKKTGYRPHRAAQNLVLKKSSLLGFVLATLKSPVYVDIFLEVEKAFRQRNYQLLLTDSAMDVEKEKLNIELMLENRVEAIVIAPVHEFHTDVSIDHLISLKSQDVPFVIMGKVDENNLDYITSEESNAAYLLTRHLIELGHKRFAFLWYRPDNRAALARYEGTVRALNEQGLSLDSQYDKPPAPASAPSEIDRILTRKDRPTAILTVNNYVGVSVIQRCKSLGLSIPGEISVVSFDELAFAGIIEPSLTTCGVNIMEVGEALVQTLSDKLANQAPNTVQRLIPQRILYRKSSGPCPVA